MRFTRILATWIVAFLLGASLLGLAPVRAAAIEHPTSHSNHASHDCAEVCAANGNSASPPVAVVQHDEYQEEDEADPVQKPDPQFYINFTQQANLQKANPPYLYKVGAIKPPDIYKLDTSYLN